jgi:uncharacterized protein YPO0396
MTEGEGELELVYGEQFKATELQVYNWGTFRGIHRMTIAPEGHLIVGASGSGKSSLLDAIAAILVPLKWHDLNAAARDQERKGKDRSVASYVRGAFSQSQDADTGEITTRFLRPEATWSALALSFDNGSGRAITLAQLLWMRGSGAKNSDMRHLYFIFDRHFAIDEFESFDLDPRKIKKLFPDDFCEEEFSPYQERFMRDLGIEGENALRLLHKTQSAKNLGDLNSFMRDFMLSEPETFEAANAMVDEFGKLNEAHQSLIEARNQIELLRPARTDLAERTKDLMEKISIADTLDRMDEWVNTRKQELFERRAARLRLEEARLSSLIVGFEDKIAGEKRSLEDLQTRYREEGGAALEGWQRELSDERRKREQRGTTLQRLRNIVTQMKRALPETPESFSALKAEARAILEAWQDPSGVHAARQAERDRLRDEKSSLARGITEVEREYESLRHQPSNIPASFLEKRFELARNAGLSESSLPFVGELLKVRVGEESWEGAIQRVLRGFSLSLLVSEDDWPRLSRAAEERHLGFRLVYYRVRRGEAPSKSGQRKKDGLPGKLDIRACMWKDWLAKELDERFSYVCVDSVKALNDYEKTVTKAGQVRHGHDRFEKDDRNRLNDQSEWTLGFSNQAKLDIFKERLKKTELQISNLNMSIAAIEEEQASQGALVGLAGRIVDLEWQDMDLAPVVARIAALEESIAASMKKGGSLERLKGEIDALTEGLGQLERDIRILYGERKSVSDNIGEDESAVRILASLSVNAFIPTTTVERLEDLFTIESEALSLENVDAREKKARKTLGDRKGVLIAEIKGLEDRIENTFCRYREKWPLDVKDLEPSLEGAPEYMARLDKLELEDLPSHEARFADYLREQSYKHLTELSTRIERNKRDIRKRMNVVNQSLSASLFGEGTHLEIEIVDRKLQEVREFVGTMREIQDRALDTGREESERRFLRLQKVIARLSPIEGTDLRWRDLVLDVRKHVEFIAHEVSDTGERVQSYRSGAGKSGGQRQRLATTCLAAALRYQLGGSRQGKPRFAMVSMDEAFDKADNEFTARIMEIFRNFGFQMIMATPNKAVMSLEPYIGGACYVGIKDENDSRLLPIGIDRATGRLDIFARDGKEAGGAQEP